MGSVRGATRSGAARGPRFDELSSRRSAVGRIAQRRCALAPRLAIVGIAAAVLVGWVTEGTSLAYTERSEGGPLRNMRMGRGEVIRVVGHIASQHLHGKETVHAATSSQSWVGRSNAHQMYAVQRLQPPTEIPQDRPKEQQAERWFFFKHESCDGGKFKTVLKSALVYSGKRDRPAPTKYEGRDLVDYILGRERKQSEGDGAPQRGRVEHDRVTVSSERPTSSEKVTQRVPLSTEVVAWIEDGERIVIEATSKAVVK